MNGKILVFVICVEAIIYFYYIICMAVPLSCACLFLKMFRNVTPVPKSCEVGFYFFFLLIRITCIEMWHVFRVKFISIHERQTGFSFFFLIIISSPFL